MGAVASSAADTPDDRPAMPRTLVAVVAALVLAVVVGLVLLWPDGSHADAVADTAAASAYYDATVQRVARGACEGEDAGGDVCTVATVRLRSGPDRGKAVELPEEVDGRGARIEPGD